VGFALSRRLFLLFSLLLPGLCFWIYFLSDLGGVLPKVVYASGKVFLLVAPLLYWRKSELVEGLRLRSLSSGQLLLSLASGVVFFAFIVLASKFIPSEIVEMGREKIWAKVADLGIQDHLKLFFLFLCVFHSFLEEYYWRTFLFSELEKRLGFPWASLVASLAFTLHHFLLCYFYFGLLWGVLSAVGVMVAGLFWCYLLYRSNSIVSPWISHFFADAAIVYVAYQYFL